MFSCGMCFACDTFSLKMFSSIIIASLNMFWGTSVRLLLLLPIILKLRLLNLLRFVIKIWTICMSKCLYASIQLLIKNMHAHGIYMFTVTMLTFFLKFSVGQVLNCNISIYSTWCLDMFTLTIKPWVNWLVLALWVVYSTFSKFYH